MKNALQPLVKSFLIPFGLTTATAAAAAADARIHLKNLKF